MRKLFKAFVRDERGVSAMEYAIMAGIVAVALTAVGTAFSSNISSLFTTMNTKVTTAASS
ncbi:Flp family type IVb pilin [Paraburkholderia phosphatilytica]|uniref:Flp family type IVb pilin n=1 Tax=Paraburkholderia phosphatilytica TaxID=2282883 RepID=UPI000E4701CA|nr:Flp family type IVb pilin [Paraburkholderia phosphatilytica]